MHLPIKIEILTSSFWIIKFYVLTMIYIIYRGLKVGGMEVMMIFKS